MKNKKLNEIDEIADGIDPTEDVDEFETEFEDVFNTEEDDYVDELIQNIESDDLDSDIDDELDIEDERDEERQNLNSLYEIDPEWKSSPFKYVNGYWLSILGMLGIAQKFPDCPIIHNYLTKPQPITEEAMEEFGDYYTDPIAAVKALYDNDIMKHFTWNDYVNLFIEMAGNHYTKIDEDKIRDLTKEMIFVDIMPHHMIRELVEKFLKGEIGIEDCVEPLYKFNILFSISPKFFEFCTIHKDDLSLEKRQEDDAEEGEPLKESIVRKVKAKKNMILPSDKGVNLQIAKGDEVTYLGVYDGTAHFELADGTKFTFDYKNAVLDDAFSYGKTKD